MFSATQLEVICYGTPRKLVQPLISACSPKASTGQKPLLLCAGFTDAPSSRSEPPFGFPEPHTVQCHPSKPPVLPPKLLNASLDWRLLEDMFGSFPCHGPSSGSRSRVGARYRMKDRIKGILLLLGDSVTIPHLSPTHLFPFPPSPQASAWPPWPESNTHQLLCMGPELRRW